MQDHGWARRNSRAALDQTPSACEHGLKHGLPGGDKFEDAGNSPAVKHGRALSRVQHLGPLAAVAAGAADEQLHALEQPGAEGRERPAVAGAQADVQRHVLLPGVTLREHRDRLHEILAATLFWTACCYNHVAHRSTSSIVCCFGGLQAAGSLQWESCEGRNGSIHARRRGHDSVSEITNAGEDRTFDLGR